MGGIFSSFNAANKGLIAQQTALQTVIHNISNANTEGFSRQRVDLKADIASNYTGVGQLGTGVKMESIVRLVDDYVSKQIRQENGTLEQYTTKAQVLDQLEVIFNEPSKTGLNFNLGEMFDSWQELSSNPENLSSKTIVVEKSKTMTDTLKHMASQTDSLIAETKGQIEKNVQDMNSIIKQLDSLNKQIFNISLKDQIPNDLLDQRDLLLRDLSATADFKADFDTYGRVAISFNREDSGFVEVLNTEGAKNVNINIDDSSISISVGEDKIAITVSSGQIKGNTEAIEELKSRRAELNNFAKTMADAINTVHTGADPANDLFFTFEDGEFDAATIQVNDKIQEDNSLVRTGKASDSPEGDGSRALAIARLRNTKLSFQEGATIEYDIDTMTIKNQQGGITIEGAYSDIVTKVGISKEHADNMVSNQGVLLDQLEQRRESTSGVSIDEEVTNLIKYQKSYEANARVISVLSEMLDTLINRTGV
ncbi:flagellar hook-associated protein 1 FlgK [Alkalibaculum bacchi]|uniref:Flagellar hook-associated protein 1 n=1 Tax=Alkalibaculum bacchi TaxID=645887 RepID=A0A366II41_9FIRM|nr:flagellar hook-associated protein FlgK [Alkalibaculum bacchi]RBP70125.1 flagellar hook-associated protein 1 FlgK [Alkalibaculum bacchi]